MIATLIGMDYAVPYDTPMCQYHGLNRAFPNAHTEVIAFSTSGHYAGHLQMGLALGTLNTLVKHRHSSRMYKAASAGGTLCQPLSPSS